MQAPNSIPSRRALLKLGSALFLTSACVTSRDEFLGPVAPGIGAGQPRPRLKKSLKIGMVGVEGDLRTKFQAAKDAGFDGIELDSPNDLSLRQVLDAKEATGLDIPGVVDSVHWTKPLSDPDPEVRAAGAAGLEQALRDCKSYGGETVLLVPAVVRREISYSDAYERSSLEIRKLLPLAEELGIKIAIENVWNDFLLSPLEAVRYVDEFESANIGWYMDIGNIVKLGWPAQWLRILGPRVFRLDIKDYSKKEAWFCGIGEGDSDWAEVMRALQDIGYHGWASAEVRGGGAERLVEIRERMDRVFAM